MRDDFPVLEVPDPNERLPSIPLRPKVSSKAPGFVPEKQLDIFSPSRVNPEDEEFLGGLVLTPAFSRSDLEGVDIDEVILKRPVAWGSTHSHPKRVQSRPEVPGDKTGSEVPRILSSFVFDPEAMNFIKLVGAYFKKLPRDRLFVVTE